MARVHDGDEADTTPIRDAACLILVDRSEAEPRLLMGRRLATQVFLPNKWVFPGGRVDEGDHALAAAVRPSITASAGDVHRLPFALAAIRELFEEAGVVVGEPSPFGDWHTEVTKQLSSRDLFPGPTDQHIRTADTGESCRANPLVEHWVPAINAGMTALAAGLPVSWQAFANTGFKAALPALTPLARAITPPGFPRRFDTWFFMADHRDAAAARFDPDGELLDLGWFTLAEVRGLDLPVITRLIVDDVARTLAAAPTPQPGNITSPIPFYYQAIEGYQRTLVDGSGVVLVP